MGYPSLAKFQIGKNGITETVMESLVLAMKNHKQVRVSVLKSFCRDREELKTLAKEIESKLPFKLKVRIIGYTIILVKLSNK